VIVALVCLALLLFIAWQNREWSKERRELLQRIQAPEIAVQQFAERPKRTPVAPVPVDDDAAFAKAREAREGLNGSGN
jgi:hypothetical protein